MVYSIVRFLALTVAIRMRLRYKRSFMCIWSLTTADPLIDDWYHYGSWFINNPAILFFQQSAVPLIIFSFARSHYLHILWKFPQQCGPHVFTCPKEVWWPDSWTTTLSAHPTQEVFHIIWRYCPPLDVKIFPVETKIVVVNKWALHTTELGQVDFVVNKLF